jgi:hypothetical protein
MARVASPPPCAPTLTVWYSSPPSTPPQSPPRHLPATRHGELQRLGFTAHGIQRHNAVVSRIQRPESSPYAALYWFPSSALFDCRPCGLSARPTPVSVDPVTHAASQRPESPPDASHRESSLAPNASQRLRVKFLSNPL